MRTSEVDTPAVLIDADILERNIRRAAEHFQRAAEVVGRVDVLRVAGRALVQRMGGRPDAHSRSARVVRP